MTAHKRVREMHIKIAHEDRHDESQKRVDRKQKDKIKELTKDTCIVCICHGVVLLLQSLSLCCRRHCCCRESKHRKMKRTLLEIPRLILCYHRNECSMQSITICEYRIRTRSAKQMNDGRIYLVPTFIRMYILLYVCIGMCMYVCIPEIPLQTLSQHPIEIQMSSYFSND